METEGLKVTFLLRLTPVIPFNAFNYVISLTNLKVGHYCLASLGMLPGTIVYVYIGTSISKIQDVATGNYKGGVAPVVLLVVGSILACVGIIWISTVVKR